MQSDNTPQSNTDPIRFVWIIIALYLLFAAAYNHLIPFRTGQHAQDLIKQNQLATNADESAHFSNILAYKSGHLPIFSADNPDYEAHQPPLYYALASVFVQNSGEQPAELARWLTIIIGGFAILVSYLAILTIFPNRPELAQGTAAFIALIPMNVNLAASLSNDTLTNLVVALAIWQTARIISKLPDMTSSQLVSQSSLLGLILAMCVYTKLSTLIVFMFVVIVTVPALRAKLFATQQFLQFGCVSCGLGLVLASPWLIRNTMLYGDPAGQHLFKQVFVQTTMTASRMTEMQHGLLGYWRYDAKLTVESFIGRFDSMLLGFYPPVYVIAGLIFLVGLFGLTKIKAQQFSPNQQVLLIGFAGLTILTLLQFIYFNMTFFQAQGRYLYLALIPIAYYFVNGFSALFNKTESAQSKLILGTTPAVIIIISGLTALNIYAIELINSVFPPVQ
jgi:hypothetical protein